MVVGVVKLVRKPFAQWIIWFVLLQTIDILETALLLHAGGRELNPPVAAALRLAPSVFVFSVKMLVAAVIVLYVAIIRLLAPRWFTRLAMGIATAIMASVVLWNLVQLAIQFF